MNANLRKEVMTFIGVNSRLFAVSLLCCVTACSSAPKLHRAPSAAPVRNAIASAQGSVADAQTNAASAISNIVKLELLTAAEPAKHEIALAVHADLDRLTKHLIDTERQLAGSQERAAELEQQARDQTDALNAAEQKAAARKAHTSFSILGIIGLVLGFVMNPFGFIVGKAMQVVAGIVVVGLLFFVCRFAWRRYRRKN